MTKRALALGIVAALLAGCDEAAPSPALDAATDARADVTPDVAPDVRILSPTVGADLDLRTPRTLPMTCLPPQPFYDALTRFGVTPAQLAQPDLGLRFDNDPTRLHWTDQVRHQGDLAPAFACMVSSDVRAALATGDTDTTLRELLVAQATYGHRAGYQTSRYDRAVTVDPAGQPLLAALQAFYEHPPVAGAPAATLPPWSERADAVADEARRFSPNAQVALAQCVVGLLAAADLRDRALTANGTTLPMWQSSLRTFFATRASGDTAMFTNAWRVAGQMNAAIDYDLLARAAQLAARSIESLRLALRDEALTPDAALSLTGPLGQVVISLQASDDTRAGDDFFLLVDGGGDDTYVDDLAVNRDLFHPVAAVLDLAGNDRYVPSERNDFDIRDGLPPDGGQGTGLAAGWFGVAVLVDAAGDDLYRTGYYQAYGMFGVGVLADHGGADRYQGYVYSQGAASFGYGLLVDRGGGDDSYETLHLSQGFGGTRGIGWLVDDAGDDRYLAITEPLPLRSDPLNNPYDAEGSNFSGAQGFGFGLRVFNPATGRGLVSLSGGLGALFDLAGADRYECAVMCQGWGYFFGAGLLYDRSGDDTYRLWHKYGIGGATHQAIGVFLDGQGADTYDYVAGGIPTNGGSEGIGLGYDHGVGFHIDRGTEADSYTFQVDRQGLGEVMGIARFPAVGVFLNEGGDDAYHLPGRMGAYALGMTAMPSPRSAAGGTLNTLSVGLFFDLGGADRYDVMHSAAANNTTWRQTAATTNTPMDPFDPRLDFGLGSDQEFRWPAW